MPDRTGPPDGSASPGTRRFVVACRGLGATADEEANARIGRRVLHGWVDPGRGYHDVEHLSEVLDRLDELENRSAAAEVAAWYHDVVYTGTPGDDERASAARAALDLAGLGVPDAAVDRVVQLVLVTVDHRPREGDREAALLCDADLAVLASPADRYDRYVAGVRHEYSHLPPEVFATGRAQVLRGLLRRTELDPGPDGPLFRSPAARGWAEAAATNLARELATLETASRAGAGAGGTAHRARPGDPAACAQPDRGPRCGRAGP